MLRFLTEYGRNRSNSRQLSEIALDGYDMFGCNLHNKTGRGCAIYVKKNNVQANPVEFSSKFQESVWISVKLLNKIQLVRRTLNKLVLFPFYNMYIVM
jgi:Holliday junction resolvase